MSNTSTGKEPVKIEISQKLREKLEEIRIVEHHNSRPFTAEEDAILLECWGSPSYRKDDIAKLLNTSSNTARKRYRYLTERGG